MEKVNVSKDLNKGGSPYTPRKPSIVTRGNLYTTGYVKCNKVYKKLPSIKKEIR
ncbi:hypothetical protein [Metabacillus niabensis]|uniref:Uncharacterized protein n=1 Tax=Metabacillus niabensis TaxID=324854 RepID=A0ABT9YZ11_9BACI|nr:hypothetical protein [Metabacillus niabensis]MDQ0225238.1 hypothetical protein [Metabacillus niabensis]